MAADQNLAARMLDPKTQAGAALELSRLGSSSEEAATWAIAAAVFSLRDTVERSMMPAVVTGADPWHMTKNDFGSKAHEPDKSQLTPEEVAEIQRANQDFMNRHLGAPLGGRVGSQVSPPRPAVTREQVAVAIASGVRGPCLQSKGECLANTRCQCARQTDAVMKLIDGETP